MPELQVAGLIVHVDRAALAAYCACYGRWCQAEEEIELHGMLYDANGLKKVNPAVRIAQDSLSLMKGYLVEFGLTPASRSKVGGTPEKAEDPMEEFLGNGGMRIAGQA